MTASTGSMGKAHRFGGDWTTAKLTVLENYLQQYAFALSKQNFRTGYIDAFAGTGYRAGCRDDGKNLSLSLPDLVEAEPQGLLDGSARIALRISPRFDKYIFIERSKERCSILEDLKQEFQDKAEDIEVRQGDANEEIQRLCNKQWNTRRAVLFLDPYGMQVDWTTIEAIAKTKAIDLWILFPLGIGVNRLLKKSGEIPESWRNRLNALLGSKDWFDEFYMVTKTTDLFGNECEIVEKASMESIGRYFVNRLKEIFPGVCENPGVLKNRVNNPLYLLCFAMGNKRGREIGLRIANHLLKGIQ